MQTQHTPINTAHDEEMAAWKAVDNAEEPAVSYTYFGKVVFDIWFCVLQAGVGKVVFDQQQHGQEQRRTAIDISLEPLAEGRSQFTITRNLIAESREWAGVTLPSIKDLGLSARELNGKWVKCTMVPSGRKFTGKDGVQKDSTTFKFLEAYDSEEACYVASLMFFEDMDNGRIDPAGNGKTAPQAPAPQRVPKVPDTSAERVTAQMFLEPLWNASGGDLNKFAGLIADNPLISKYFSINSPEVIAIVDLARRIMVQEITGKSLLLQAV